MPILIGLAVAITLMAVAVIVAVTTAGGDPEASPIPTVATGESSVIASDPSAPTDGADGSPSVEASALALECSGAADVSVAIDRVLVYFTCEHPPADPRPVVRIHAGVDSAEDRLRFALEQLLAGPTSAESDLGYSSIFPSDSEELLIGVEVKEDGLAIIDFADDLRRVNNLNASTPRFMVFGSLGATAFQFNDVAAIEFRIEGSCEQFARHFETTCEPWLPGSTDFSSG